MRKSGKKIRISWKSKNWMNKKNLQKFKKTEFYNFSTESHLEKRPTIAQRSPSPTCLRAKGMRNISTRSASTVKVAKLKVLQRCRWRTFAFKSATPIKFIDLNFHWNCPNIGRLEGPRRWKGQEKRHKAVGGTARCDVLTSSFGFYFVSTWFVGLLEWFEIGNPRSFFL